MSLCLRAPHASPTARSSPPPGPRFTHVKCAPSPSLAPFVDHYWVTRWDRRDEPPRTAALLLDPCVHLQVCGGGAEVIGLRRGLLRTRIEGLGCVAGVRFRPGGFFPFVQRPVAEW